MMGDGGAGAAEFNGLSGLALCIPRPSPAGLLGNVVSLSVSQSDVLLFLICHHKPLTSRNHKPVSVTRCDNEVLHGSRLIQLDHFYVFLILHIPCCFALNAQAQLALTKRWDWKMTGGRRTSGGEIRHYHQEMRFVFIKVEFLSYYSVDRPSPDDIWWHWRICKSF